jgi:hypothetical protein
VHHYWRRIKAVAGGFTAARRTYRLRRPCRARGHRRVRDAPAQHDPVTAGRPFRSPAIDPASGHGETVPAPYPNRGTATPVRSAMSHTAAHCCMPENEGIDVADEIAGVLWLAAFRQVGTAA